VALASQLAPLLLPEIHVGDVGIALIVVVVDETGTVVNISTASTLTILLLPPGNSPTNPLLTKPAMLDTNGVDGAMRYTTQAGDLSVAGTWQIQGQVVIGSAMWSTRSSRVLVLPVV
jgi:hypothetical protein